MLKHLPKVLSLLFLWSVVLYIVFYIDPVLVEDVWIKGSYAPLVLAVFLALFYTVSVILSSVKLGLVFSLVSILLLVLSIYKVLTVITLVLSVLFIIIFAYHLYSSKNESRSG